jgi:hypothetical protein
LNPRPHSKDWNDWQVYTTERFDGIIYGSYVLVYLEKEIYFVSSISMCTLSGTCTLIICLRNRSSASTSITLLCILISQCSNVSVPSPSGIFYSISSGNALLRGSGSNAILRTVAFVFTLTANTVPARNANALVVTPNCFTNTLFVYF